MIYNDNNNHNPIFYELWYSWLACSPQPVLSFRSSPSRAGPALCVGAKSVGGARCGMWFSRILRSMSDETGWIWCKITGGFVMIQVIPMPQAIFRWPWCHLRVCCCAAVVQWWVKRMLRGSFLDLFVLEKGVLKGRLFFLEQCWKCKFRGTSFGMD